MGHGLFRHLAHRVFDEHRVVVSLFRHVFFIRPFQQGIDLAGGARLGHGDEVFHPDKT